MFIQEVDAADTNPDRLRSIVAKRSSDGWELVAATDKFLFWKADAKYRAFAERNKQQDNKEN